MNGNSRLELIEEIRQAEAEIEAQKANDPKKRIAEAQAELTRLNQQQRQADLAADIAQNEQYIRANEQAIQEFIRQLTAAARLLDEVTRPPFPADETYNAQQAFVSNALGRYLDGWNTPETLARLNAQDYREQEAARNEQRRDYLAAESRFRDGSPLWLALVNWINQAADPATQQLRMGIVFVITGQLYPPDELFDFEEQKNRISAENRRRFSRGV